MDATELVAVVQRIRNEAKVLADSFARHGMYGSAEVWQTVVGQLTRVLTEAGAE